MPARTASTLGDEDVATHGGGQHPLANKAGMRGCVAGAAAGHQCHLFSVPVIANNDTDVGVSVEAGQLAARRGDGGLERLRDGIFPRIDELLHVPLPDPWPRDEWLDQGRSRRQRAGDLASQDRAGQWQDDCDVGLFAPGRGRRT